MDDYEYLTPTQSDPPKRELTIGQEVALHMCDVLADDLDTHHASRSDQATAALLHLMADAIRRNYEAELVRVVAAWRRGVEGAGG